MKPFGKFAKLIIRFTPKKLQNTTWYWAFMRFFQYKRHFLHHTKQGFIDAYYELPTNEYKGKKNEG